MKIEGYEAIKNTFESIENYDKAIGIINLPHKESEELGKDYDIAEISFSIKEDKLIIFKESVETGFSYSINYNLKELDLEVTKEDNGEICLHVYNPIVSGTSIWLTCINDLVGDFEVNQNSWDGLLSAIKEA